MYQKIKQEIKKLEEQIIDLTRLLWYAKRLKYLPYEMYLKDNKIIIMMHNYEELSKLKKTIYELTKINNFTNNKYIELKFFNRKAV